MPSPFGAPAPSGSGSAASPLDGPPPSPTPMGGGGAFGMAGLAPGGPGAISADKMPPEVLTGITQAAQTMAQQLDSFAQVTPDKAAALAMIKELLQQYLAEIMTAGAGPVSPTAAGPAPPMGGVDRGIPGAGSVP